MWGTEVVCVTAAESGSERVCLCRRDRTPPAPGFFCPRVPENPLALLNRPQSALGDRFPVPEYGNGLHPCSPVALSVSHSSTRLYYRIQESLGEGRPHVGRCGPGLGEARGPV